MSNPAGNPNWKGASGNPDGRKPGSRNRRTAEIVQQINKMIYAGQGQDPLVRLFELTNSEDGALAASASNMLAPFLHSKVQPSPLPRFIEAAPELPPLTSLQNAVQSIALISAAMAENRLDVQSGQDLIASINAYISGRNIQAIEELQARVDLIESQAQNQPPQTQNVVGGLPPLPGTNVILNRQPVAPEIDHDPAPSWESKHEPSSSEPSETEPVSAESQANDPTITFAPPADWDADHWKCR